MKTRRDFIKISAVGTGALALGLSSVKIANAEDSGGIFKKNKKKPVAHERFPTYCEVCFWKCAGWTYRDENGKIIKIIGNDEDPHCNGRLCPRGTGGIGMYYDEDRLKTPLIRVGEPGNQSFREASWDEAFDLIAKKLIKFKEETWSGMRCFIFSWYRRKNISHLIKAYGSPNITAPSFAQCRGPREVAFAATFGEEVLSPERTDIRDTKCLVLIGSHIGENMHNGQVQEMSEAIDKGATIITVDPRFSTAASNQNSGCLSSRQQIWPCYWPGYM